MMKLTMAALALSSATMASAETPCPPSWSEAYTDSFGPQTGSGKIWSIHEPAGLTMLGETVPYLVVQRDTYMWEVWYRLGTKVRASEKATPPEIIAAFAQAYPGASCGPKRCQVRVPRNDATRWLTYVDIMDSGAPGPNLTGRGAALVTRDNSLWERAVGPLYLRCSYNTQIPGLEMK